MMHASNRRARGDPREGGASRPPVFFSLLLIASLFGTTHAPAAAQWPPWLKKEPSKPVVYPEILIDAAAFEEAIASGDASGLLVVDARDESSFAAGHVPGTRWVVPPDSVGFGAYPAALPGRRGLDASDRLCVVGGVDPRDAARLYWALRAGGRENVVILEGGYPAWRRAVRGRREAEPGAARHVPRFGKGAVPDTSLVASADWVNEHYGQKGFEILDVRDSTAWRAGHVPHALPFDPRIVVGRDGSFMSGEEIRAILARLGPRPSTVVDLESEFVVYDEGDSRDAALAALVLRLGGVERVRVFPGGWRAWIRDPDRPIVKVVGAGEVAARLGADPSTPPDDVLFFDVRNHRDHSIRFIPGSVCVQSDQFPDSLDAVVDRLRPGADRRDLTLILYCYGEDCIRSRQCATWAARAGFRDLWWFLGGLPEWMGSGRETATDR